MNKTEDFIERKDFFGEYLPEIYITYIYGVNFSYLIYMNKTELKYE